MKKRKSGIGLGPPVEGSNRMPENVVLARFLRRRRERLGLSQNQFSSLVGVTRPMLAGIDSGKYLPGLDTLGLIARQLGTSSSRLLAEAERWVARLPAWLDLCELQVDRGDGKGFIPLAFDTTPGYTDTAPFPATPVKWTYRAIYRVGDTQVGIWSAPVSITVPA